MTTEQQLASHIEAIIRLLGEDPTREGLVKTPVRAARALQFLTKGYRQNPEDIINGALFTTTASGMVIVRDIEFYSMCEHHILPFFGRVTIGYIPRGKVLGLSKLPRLVDFHARRLQLQERLTSDIAAEISLAASTPDVIVTTRAQHLCMMMRGVEKQHTDTLSIATIGRFDAEPALRAEFLSLVNQH